MEPSGAKMRSSGSGKFSASTMTCGLRFNGAAVTVAAMVGVVGARGVNVSVAGIAVSVGENGVREATSGAGAVVLHAKEIMRYVNIRTSRVRLCGDFMDS